MAKAAPASTTRSSNAATAPTGATAPSPGLRPSASVSVPGGPTVPPPDLSLVPATPMMRQYLDAKAEVPGAILMFRMGDFFELFFDDAKIAARELELTLTARDKSRDGREPIPMAGVPHHAVGGYIHKLIDKGYTVALCDQIEDPRFAKGLVKRQITRVITPGTVVDLEALDPAAQSYLGAVVRGAQPQADGRGEPCVLALLDLLAGELLLTEVEAPRLGDELRRMGVRELLVVGPPPGASPSTATPSVEELLAGLDLGAAPLPRRVVDWPMLPADLLGQRLAPTDLTVLRPTPSEAAALAALVAYAEASQRRPLVHLGAPRRYDLAQSLGIDDTTRKNLELVETQRSGERRGSLLWHLDRTRTALGARRLRQWLLFPLRDRAAIEARLDVVAALLDARELRADLAAAFDGVRDIERLVGRVVVGRATPRDLGALRASLAAAPALRDRCGGLPELLGRRWQGIDLCEVLASELETALVDTPPMVSNDGGIFRRGYDSELDGLITLAEDSHAVLADLEQRERQRTGIANLKVRFNRVFGYYIEITKANLAAAPSDYERKQTLVGAERFTTPELKEFESKVLTADERRKAKESELFAALVARALGRTEALRSLGRLIADTDALNALATVAAEARYSRPVLSDEPVLEIDGGRHPVIERLMPLGESFVPTHLSLGAPERRLVLVTGPNMAGKSTVLRQAALLTLLAHVGSFVPARRATIGLCDRILTRVGAADDLGRGQSTFMVEMLETAAILRQATRKSLVVLDEIGRGTSTYDGVSIAWAVAEHLRRHNDCRALFATHYHELCDLAAEVDGIALVSMAVEEKNGKVAFLREVVEGGASRSYGVHVAALAGVPEEVVARAQEMLAKLERSADARRGGKGAGRVGRAAKESSGESSKASAKDVDNQLGLFAPRREPSAAERALLAVDPNQLTPVQALVVLEELRRLVETTAAPLSDGKSAARERA